MVGKIQKHKAEPHEKEKKNKPIKKGWRDSTIRRSNNEN